MGAAGAMCMIDEGERFAVYVRMPRRARKSHKCDECGRAISPGETYEVFRGLYDGQWEAGATCAHCRVAQEWLSRECGGFLHHGVADDIEDHFREGYGFGVGRLAVGMRWGWTSKRGELAPLPRIPKLSTETVS